MKRTIALLLCVVLVLCAFAGCAAKEATEEPVVEEPTTEEPVVEEPVAEEPATEEPTAEEPVEEDTLTGELVIFAAASMQETLTEIAENFKTAHPNVEILLTFDSSGTLKTQIEEGADCDIFISAGQKQMNQLDIEADAEVNVDGLDFVLTETRFNLLENKVVLAVADTDTLGIDSFDTLADLLANDDTILMAMGNEDVPVGQYTQKILAYYNLDEATLAEAGKITYGTNVKEVTTQVTEGTVNCGVIYATDAFSAGLTWVDEATKDMCGQIIYPAAVMKATDNREAADAFLEYLKGEEASAVLAAVGFTPLN